MFSIDSCSFDQKKTITNRRGHYNSNSEGEEITLATANALRDEGKPYTARIDTTDAEGRVIDLHALRTTLGTRLARAGVAPQIAQRIMRHSDYKTTLKHYTVLGLADGAAAVNAMPMISDSTAPTENLRATGTTDATVQPIATFANPLDNPLGTEMGDFAIVSETHDVSAMVSAPDEQSHVLCGEFEVISGNQARPPIGFEPTTCALQMRCSTN